MSGRAGPRRVLWVSEQPPHSSAGGGAIRQAHLLRALARVHSVDLLVAGSLSDDSVRAAAENVIELPRRPAVWTNRPILRKLLLLGVTLAYPYPLIGYLAGPARRPLRKAVRELHDRYDLVCVEHLALGPVIPRRHAQPFLITLHNLPSGMMQSEADLAAHWRKRWFRGRDAAKARRMESRVLRDYDRCITCSEEDAAALAERASPGAADRISVIPNGVDLDDFRPLPVPSEPRVLFPGTLSYSPNVDGAFWLCSEIWPRVRAAVPEAKLTIVGRIPAPEIFSLAEVPGVEIHVDVPAIVPYFESARVVVVPLRVGTGTRLKALQAMAAARPVVGTTVGLEGLGMVDGAQGRVLDDPEAFAAACVEILRRDELASALGSAGRAHVEAHFGWERIGRRFVELVNQVLDELCPDGAGQGRRYGEGDAGLLRGAVGGSS
jgi:glycosyltransferase involved in cell wall biosynthesis